MTKSPPFQLALITGASSGIGKALALILASHHIPLILTGRDKQRLQEIGKQTKAQHLLAGDLKEKKTQEELFGLIRELTPDLVVNNAGFGFYGDALTIPIKDQLAILEVNAAVPLEVTLEAAHALSRKGKKGVIMNISSVAGEHPCPGMSVYGASKSFLTQVSVGFNTELASKGISVLACCPGMVETEFGQRAAKKEIAVSGPVMTAQFAAEQIWKQIQNKQEKKIINAYYRFASWFANHFVPASLVKQMIWKKLQDRL